MIWAAAAIVAAYAWILLRAPALGPGDEYVMLRTLQTGGWAPMWIRGAPDPFDTAKQGRFSPFVGQEYNLAAMLSRSAASYCGLNALQLIVFAVAYWLVLERLVGSSFVGLVAFLAVVLSPGLVLAWTRFYWGERMVALSIAVFLLARTGQAGPVDAVVGTLAAIIAMGYKEPAFLAFAAYSVMAWPHDRGALLTMDRLVLAAAAVYVGIFAGWIWPYRQATYSVSHYRWPLVAIKNIANYAFFSDPVVMLLALPLVIVNPTPALVAAMWYVIPFLATNVYNPYYLLPALVWAVPELARAWTVGWFTGSVWQVLFGLTVVISIGNSLPAALHWLTFYKYMPANFMRTVEFLVAEISRGRHSPRIFLAGVDRSRHMTNFMIWYEYLTHYGLPANRFDMESSQTRTHPVGPVSLTREQLACCGAYSDTPVPEVEPGDYLVVGPDANDDTKALLLEALANPRYRLVFCTRSRCAVPLRTLKTWLKVWVARWWTHAEGRRNGWILNRNRDEWPDYYVLVRA